VSDPAKKLADMTKKNQEIMKSVNKIEIDLQPGEILYMPAGWFHHIKNMGPTVMVNHWTRNMQMIGLVKVLKEAA
jgi:jumonji domain-containing protein 7